MQRTYRNAKENLRTILENLLLSLIFWLVFIQFLFLIIHLYMHFALEQKTKKLTGTKMGMNYKENKLFKSMNPCRGGSASEFHQITFS